MRHWTLVRLASRASVSREPYKCPTNGMQVSHTPRPADFNRPQLHQACFLQMNVFSAEDSHKLQFAMQKYRIFSIFALFQQIFITDCKQKGYSYDKERQSQLWQQTGRNTRVGRFGRRTGQHLAIPLRNRQSRRSRLHTGISGMHPPVRSPHHDSRVLHRTTFARQHGRRLPHTGSGHTLALGGTHGRAGRIPHPGLLLGSGGLDAGVHPRSGHQQLCRQVGRPVHRCFRQLRGQSLATYALDDYLPAGHALHRGERRRERHRES